MHSMWRYKIVVFIRLYYYMGYFCNLIGLEYRQPKLTLRGKGAMYLQATIENTRDFE